MIAVKKAYHKDMMSPHYSLVIPAYNEALYIGPTLRELIDACRKVLGESWEIVVVDNHSSDDTASVARGLGDPHVVVISEPNGGKGSAWKSGTRLARGKICAMTDADLSIDPTELAEKMLWCNLNQAEDIVVGNRLHADAKTGDREWWRGFTSRVFNFCINIVLPLTVSDSQCPFKIYNEKAKQILLSCTEDTWYTDAEFLYRARLSDLRITEIPISWFEHRYPERKTKVRLIDGPWTAVAAFRVRAKIFFTS